MDEPTSALDVVAQRSLMRQIKELQERLGFAVIFVTHDISLVSHFSDRLMVMYAGQVAELGPTSTVFGTPRHPYSRALLEAFPSIRGKRSPSPASPGPHPTWPRRHRAAASSLAVPTPCPSAPRSKPPLYERGGSVVRCLLYQDAVPGTTESLAGRSARETGSAGCADGGHAGTTVPSLAHFAAPGRTGQANRPRCSRWSG